MLISRASALEEYSNVPLRLKVLARHRLLLQEAVTQAAQASQAAVSAGCASLAASLLTPSAARRCPRAFPSPVTCLTHPLLLG